MDRDRVVLAGTDARARYLVGADGAHSQGPIRLGQRRCFIRGSHGSGLRLLADLPLPNGFFDAMLGTAALRLVASSICFHRRSGTEAIDGASSVEQNLREPAD